jgi:hypothetical protein
MEDGVVCPAILQKGLFTTSAVDNIDHNPSATTATISCHGTGISVFQHPVSSTFSDSRTFEFKGQKPKSKAISCLPETYTNVKPAFLKSKPNPPILQTPMSMFDLDYLVRNLRLEYEWLQFVSLTNEVLDVETVSWSAYHSSKGRGPHVNISISSLTSLLRKKMLLSISKDLSCKQDILGGSRYVSRQLYHHLPGVVGKKIAEFGSHTGHHWRQ